MYYFYTNFYNIFRKIIQLQIQSKIIIATMVKHNDIETVENEISLRCQ